VTGKVTGRSIGALAVAAVALITSGQLDILTQVNACSLLFAAVQALVLGQMLGQDRIGV
jgi:hypothetical protein